MLIDDNVHMVKATSSVFQSTRVTCTWFRMISAPTDSKWGQVDFGARDKNAR